MRQFRLDVSRKNGVATLWMSTEQSPCGYTPLISWSNIHGLREFSEMLLDMYRHSIRESERIRQTSDSILQRVFSGNEFNEEGDNSDS